MIQLVLAFLFPIVLTIVALYLKYNIKIDIGKSGYITKKSVETKETWIYAQIIAPKIYLKIAAICLVIDFVVTTVMLIGGSDYNMIIEVCNCVGFIFTFMPFFLIDKRIEDFQKNFFEKENKKCESAEWLKLVIFLITEKSFSELETALNPSMWKELFNEKSIEEKNI